VEAHLLGKVEYDACLALQNRLVFESTGRQDGQITLLFCEHPLILTVGRRGSWGHIELSQRELASRQLRVRWVNHGGACMVHLPGQLAVYPIVPLQHHGFSVAGYLDRLQQGIVAALEELGFAPETREGRYGVWGRTGQLVALGVAVKDWTAYHGAVINVSPAMGLFRYVRTDPEGGSTMSSLSALRRQPIRMASVREALVRHLVSAFECERFHTYAGHALWQELQPNFNPTSLRAI